MSDERREQPMELTTVSSKEIGQLITGMMEPILNAIGTMLKNNTEAIDRISATQTVMSNRMEALEKQIRLQTPVDDRQARYLNNAMKNKARELLDKKGLADNKLAVSKVTSCIRKSVLSRYGIGNVRQIPRHEYPVAMNQIEMWNDILAIRDVARQVKEREG